MASRSSKLNGRFSASAVSAMMSLFMRLVRNVTLPELSCPGRYSGYDANHLWTKSPTVVTRGPTRRSHTESARNCPVSGTSLIQPRSLGLWKFEGVRLPGLPGGLVEGATAA